MTYERRYATLPAIALCLLSGMTSLAQSASRAESSDPTGYAVTQIVGLPDAKPNVKGQLTMSTTELLFANTELKAEIPFARMTSVSVGDVRIETGGKTGRIMRTVIPYGGGMAVASVTQKSADLLTIEYVDLKGGYHGVVFSVPKLSAKVLSDRIASQLPTTIAQLPQPCIGGSPSPTSVVVEPISASGAELPAEYRVLLYESLVNELRDSATAATYTRAGSLDAGSGCPTMKLRVTVTGFKKGNQALRAETGPVGYFVGKTSVSFHVELTAADGRRILSEDMTSSKRMDSESLGVTKAVAKSVSKKMRKLPMNKMAS